MKSIAARVVVALLLCLPLGAIARDGFFLKSLSAATPVEFYPGWYGSSLQIMTTSEGVVHLRGFAVGDYAGGPYAWKLFVLPPGTRPAIPEYFLVRADGGYASINVMPDGWVWVATNSSLWVSLSGVSYVADH